MITHRPNRRFYVGVVGAARAGKDSFARALAATLPHVTVLPFALPIKVLSLAATGFVAPNRAALVGVGAAVRNHCPDAWITWHRRLVEVELLKDQDPESVPRREHASLKNYRFIIIPDVRFHNEMHYIREHAPHCLLVGIRHAVPEQNDEHDVASLLRWCDFVVENRYVDAFNPSTHFRAIVHDVVQRICDLVLKDSHVHHA